MSQRRYDTPPTPGPWSYEGRAVYGTSKRFKPRVCLMSEGDYVHSDADAALIAAAPDLLDALKDAAGFLDNPISRKRNFGDPFFKGTVDRVNAAIAKAEGNQ